MTLTQINKAGLDELALDHVFTIGASGTDHYTFQGEGLNGTVNDPTLYLTRGKTYRFENGTGAHPIRIQSTSGASGTAYNTGVTNNAGSGTVIVEVQHDAPDVLYYQCTSHANMGGTLYIAGALADGGVTTAKLAADAVNGTKIADNAVAAEHIAANAVGSSELADNAVDTAAIADDAVTAAKIAAGAVSTTELSNSGVSTNKIADDAVTSAKIAAGAVSTTELSNSGVTTAKIADGNVTAAKLASGVQTTINNNADNRVITGSGTANTLNGESNLIFDGSSLGIRTTPSQPFHINQAGSSTTMRIENANADFLIQAGSAGNGGLHFYDMDNSAYRVLLDNSGRVGIGTASPSHKLHVEGSASGVIAAKQTTNNGGFNIYEGDASDGTTKFYVTHNGRVGAADGIIFGTDTAAGNILNDYEEGTFSPAVAAGTTVTQTFDSQGRYTKIGRQVYVQFLLQYSGAGTSAHFKFSGLPFTALNNSSRGGGTVLWTNIPGLNDFDAISAIVSGDDTAIFLYYNMDNNATTGSGGFTNKAIYVRVTYEAA